MNIKEIEEKLKLKQEELNSLKELLVKIQQDEDNKSKESVIDLDLKEDKKIKEKLIEVHESVKDGVFKVKRKMKAAEEIVKEQKDEIEDLIYKNPVKAVAVSSIVSTLIGIGVGTLIMWKYRDKK